MNLIFKISYIAGIIFICICAITGILVKVIPLEFSSESYANAFDTAVFWGIPLAILLTIGKIGFQKNKERVKIRTIVTSRVIIAFLYLVVFIFYLMSTFSFDMCGWSRGETIFRNKSNPAIRIERRYFGCGATDSGPAIASAFKVRSILPFFLYAEQIDTGKIDITKWDRMAEK